MLLWLLVVGYRLRTAEVRLETRAFGGKDGGPPGDGGNLFGSGGAPKKGPWGGGFGGWGRLLPGGGGRR